MGREIRDWAKYTDKTQEKGRRKKRRLLGIALLIILFFAGYRLVPAVKLFFRGQEPQGAVEEQSVSLAVGSPVRKNIYDRRLNIVAASVETTSIYVKPREFKEIGETAQLLSGTLGIDEAQLAEELKTERNFTWIARDIPQEKAQQVRDLSLAGVYFVNKKERIYPRWLNAPQFIGQVKDDIGLSGLEFSYNEALLADSHLILTLDLRLQDRLENLLEELLEKAGYKMGGSLLATTAYGVVMDVQSGEVLASALLPLSQGYSSPFGIEADGTDRIVDVPVRAGGLAALHHLAEAVASGFRMPDDAGNDGSAHKTITPRKEKLVKRKLSKPWWEIDREKNIISPWLAAIANELEKSRSEQRTALHKVDGGKEANLSGHGFQSPNSRPTALHLLESFAYLINGGKPVAPRLLLARASDDGNIKREKSRAEAVPSTFSEEESAVFRSLLEETASVRSHYFIAQSLQTSSQGEQLSAEDSPDQYDDEIIVKRGGMYRGNHMPDTFPAAAVSGDNTILYDGTILAAAPIQRPKVVMLLAFNQGMVDVTRPSDLERPIASFLQTALDLKGGVEKINKKVQLPDLDTDHLLASWKKLQAGIGGTGKTGKSDSVGQLMPDVRGLSLRKALRTLQPFGLKIVIQGSGTVVRQHPAAGRRIQDDRCVLMAQDAGRPLDK